MTYNHIACYMYEARLGELLDRKGMTREELSKLTGASPEAIKAMEHGNYDPPLSMAYKLAAALEIPVDRLFTD